MIQRRPSNSNAKGDRRNLAPMTRQIWIVVGALATLAVCLLLWAGALPLGIAGEWEWGRIERASPVIAWATAGVVAVAYVAFVAVGRRWVERGGASRGWAVAALVPAGFAVQFAAQGLGFGLAKWAFVLVSPASSGYYTTARQISDLSEFLKHYEQFQLIEEKVRGPFHLATHPPGLIVLHYAALRLCETHPNFTRALLATEPPSARDGFRAAAHGQRLPPPDEASLWLVAVISQLACVATVVPLYWLARRGADDAAGWLAAAMWPLVPAATIFCPKSDVLYPLVATSCIALFLAGQSRGGRCLCAATAGVIMWLGLFHSLALLAVTPIMFLAAALDDPWRSATHWRSLGERGAAAGLGLIAANGLFWLVTDHNLWATWRRCFAIHAHFYDRVHRSYWPWVGFNLAEFSVALGLPLAVAALAGTAELCRARRAGSPPAADPIDPSPQPALGARAAAVVCAWWTTLLVLDLSGKNLGEVARLWILMMPLAAPAAAVVMRGDGSGRGGVVLLVLQAVQMLVFAAGVQGFYDPASVKL
jgi:hypothetical protein